MRSLLIVDDNQEFVLSLERAMSRAFEVHTAGDLPSARRSATAKQPDAVLLDVRLSDKESTNRDGLTLLSWFRDDCPTTPIIVMTALDDVAVAVEAMKRGAADFVVKTRLQVPELLKTIEHVLETSRLQRVASQLARRLDRWEPSELVGDSAEIGEIRRLIDDVAGDGQCNVLIVGESGTGKEVVARAIHQRGPRRDQPFVVALLAGLPKDVVARDLFGNEAGAFTGAAGRRIGYFEEAKGGVLFLDEIGELGLDMQVLLLRALENRQFCRIGGTKPVAVDCQVVAATNRQLEAAVAAGEFRRDLYYRLKAIQIALPPLDNRVDDIRKLALHFLHRFNLAGRTPIRAISEDAIRALQSYPWPGNVRELRNCIEYAVLRAKRSDSDEITKDHLPVDLVNRRDGATQATPVSIRIPADGVNIHRELARFEVGYIRAALRQAGGKRTEAWKLLGYHDRYTMRRRVSGIAKRYPDLTVELNGTKTEK